MAALVQRAGRTDGVADRAESTTGVLVVVGIWQGLGGGTAIGVAACTLAVIGYGISYPYVRRHLATGENAMAPLTFATGLMIMGTLQIGRAHV